VAASATFAAVLVALFKDEVLRFLRRPKLTVSIALAPPDCHKTMANYRTPQGWQSADCYYLRLWVENVGKTRAERVQVFAASLSRRNADGNFRKTDEFLPMNLRWAHGQQAAGGPEIFAEGISPQMGKHCDLGHVMDPESRADVGEDLPNVPAATSILALDLEFPPNTRSHLIPPGTYQLALRVAAANSTPVTKTIEVTTTGEWFADQARMFTEGLGIRMV
jgi:hypothetical protein